MPNPSGQVAISLSTDENRAFCGVPPGYPQSCSGIHLCLSCGPAKHVGPQKESSSSGCAAKECHLRDARTRFMFIAIRSALRVTIAACEAVITSLAVSENSFSQRAKYLSSIGKGKCASSGLPL